MAVNKDQDVNPYTIYKITTTYIKKGGLLQMPKAGPVGSSCEIARVHAGSWIKVVAWIAERQGKMPDIPDTASGNDNEFFNDCEFGLPSKDLTPDGNGDVYRLTGIYYYLLKNPPDPKAGQIGGGKPPFDDTPASNTVLSASQFRSDLLPNQPAVFNKPN